MKKIDWEFTKGQIIKNLNGIDYFINAVLPNNEIIVTSITVASNVGWQCTAIKPCVYKVDSGCIQFDWEQSKNGRFVKKWHHIASK